MADTNTVIGQTILIKGNLQGDEDLTVQGRIEGSVHLTKTLIVEPNGVVKADVSVCNAIISGAMVGNLSATDSLEIAESGRMVGDIRAPRVIITEGALFKGQVDMGDLEGSRDATEARPTATRTGTARMEPLRRAAAVAPKAAPLPARTASAPKVAVPVPTPKPVAKPAPKIESRFEPKAEKKTSLEIDEDGGALLSKKKVVVKKRR